MGGLLVWFVVLDLIARFSTDAARGRRRSASHLRKRGSARPGGGSEGKVNQAVFKNLPAGPRGGWRF